LPPRLKLAVPRTAAPLALALALALSGSMASFPSGASAQQYYRPLPDEYYRGPRVRFATEGELGAIAGRDSGLGGGLGISIGLQINDIFAAYMQHRMFFAASLDPASADAFATSFNSFVLELTVFETIQVGGGPSLDAGIDGLCARQLERCPGTQGPYVGIETRVAIVIGDRSLARRRGLVLAAHVHPTWIDARTATTTISISAGFQLY
jgi:hypothetical protein